MREEGCGKNIIFKNKNEVRMRSEVWKAFKRKMKRWRSREIEIESVCVFE